MAKTKIKHKKKPTKKSLTRKLDKLFGEIVRSRGYCVKCGKTQHLQAAHIISRSHRATRWHFDNVLCLCPDCHINFAHKNPLLFDKFVEQYLGKERYSQLTMMATMIKKWTLEEMQELYLSLSKPDNHELHCKTYNSSLSSRV